VLPLAPGPRPPRLRFWETFLYTTSRPSLRLPAAAFLAPATTRQEPGYRLTLSHRGAEAVALAAAGAAAAAS
jgi:hypothetical protein